MGEVVDLGLHRLRKQMIEACGTDHGVFFYEGTIIYSSPPVAVVLPSSSFVREVSKPDAD